MRLIFIGPPGVGKGTQAKRICDHFGIVHLSTGEILRSEIDQHTHVGESAKQYIDNGALVPDEILLKIMSKRLAQKDCRAGYCLDGFPRTIPQAQGLDDIQRMMDVSLNAIISITANNDELINRLVLRGKDSGRSDDTPEIIRQRLDVYTKHTAPLIQFYDKKNLVKSIDGIGNISEITQRILKRLT